MQSRKGDAQSDEASYASYAIGGAAISEAFIAAVQKHWEALGNTS